MTTTSIYEAQAHWRPALFDAKRAAANVAQLQADADRQMMLERAEEQARIDARFAYAGRYGGWASRTGMLIDEWG